MNYEQSTRYLNAFSDIEGVLRRLVGVNEYLPFYQLIKETAKKEKFIKKYANDLFEFADLRNAIVHERSNGEPIAEPHVNTVLRLEAIRDLIIKPPTVQPLFFRDVFICQAADPIGKAAKMMLKSSFSQVPIYADEIFAGLLTTQTIARWLAAKLETGIGLLEEESVKNVLNFSEYSDNYRFIKKNTTLFDVWQCFDDFAQKGRNLDALIITHSGKSNEKPLGIVTVFDLPEIFRIIEI